MRNVLKNIVTGIALAAAGMTVATAQEFTFGVGAQVQLSALDAVGVAETSDLGYGGGGGLMLDLGLQLGDHWSIHTGAGYSLFKTRLELDRLSGSVDATDVEGEDFTFNYALDNYAERQEFGVVSIPLHLQYEGSGTTRFYVRGGASYNILLDQTQQGSVGRLETSGFFPRFNGTLTAPAFEGFGTFGDREFSERDLDLDDSINLSLEAGVKQVFEAGSSIYVGLFVEHGLNDISSDETRGSFVSYNAQEPTDFINNGAFGSNVRGDRPAVEEARLFYTGLRVRFQWGGPGGNGTPAVNEDQ